MTLCTACCVMSGSPGHGESTCPHLPLCGSRMNLVLLLNQLTEQVKEAGFAVVADVVDVPQA
jgi:hypothetical protein